MSLFLGGTGTANECHDYEEGSFTMSLSAGSNTSSSGRYVKIGTMVLAAGNVSLDNISSGSNVTINGLPFTSDGGGVGRSYNGSLRGYNCSNISGSGMRPTNAVIHGDDQHVQFGTMESAQAWSMMQYNDFTSTNNSVRWTCVYKSND